MTHRVITQPRAGNLDAERMVVFRLYFKHNAGAGRPELSHRTVKGFGHLVIVVREDNPYVIGVMPERNA